MAKAKRPAVDHPVVGDGDVERSGRSGRGSVALVGGAVAAVFLVWFALANLSKVKINFWIYDRSEPLILVILIAGVLGAVIGALVMRARLRNKSGQ